jgi:glycerol kinase
MILGIDQGTTGTRVALVDDAGQIRAQVYRTHRQRLGPPGWIEHDAEEILAAVVAGVDAVAGRGRAPASSGAGPIRAAALANQGETCLLWDRQSGAPLGRALVWQDLRATRAVERLAAEPGLSAYVAAVTGLRLDPYFSAPKLGWLLGAHAEAPALAAAGRLGIGTLDTFLIERLTGRYVSDASTAARTLLFDIHARRWDERLCAAFGVPRAALPEVVDHDQALGTFTTTAARGVPLQLGIVDQPAALYGQRCLAPGDAKATFGTGCFVYVNTGGVASPSARGLLRTVAWRRAGATTFALDGGVLAAGSVIEWLRTTLSLAPTDAALDELAAAGFAAHDRRPVGSGPVCVPALVGLGAPHWQRGARAAWLGLDLATDRAALVAAAYDGIAARVAEVVDAMEAEAGTTIPRLVVDGGLTASAPLMQRVADLLGRPVAVAREAETTLVGACALARAALGRDSDTAAPGGAEVGYALTYTPTLLPDERAARLTHFTRARELVGAYAASAPA